MLREIESKVFVPEVEDLIYEEQNAIPEDFCDYLIEKFESSKNVHGSNYNSKNIEKGIGYNRNFYFIESGEYWKSDTSKILEYASKVVSNYFDRLGSICQLRYKPEDTYLDSIKLCRYDLNDDFNWHNDQIVIKRDDKYYLREYQIICYLNTVDSGGETEYPVFGKKIKSEKGKVLVAPSNFVFFHKAFTPKSNSKYCVVIQVARKFYHEVVSKDE